MENRASLLYRKAIETVYELEDAFNDVEIERIFNIGVNCLLEQNEKDFCDIMEKVVLLKPGKDVCSEYKESSEKIIEELNLLLYHHI